MLLAEAINQLKHVSLPPVAVLVLRDETVMKYGVVFASYPVKANLTEQLPDQYCHDINFIWSRVTVDWDSISTMMGMDLPELIPIHVKMVKANLIFPDGTLHPAAEAFFKGYLTRA